MSVAVNSHNQDPFRVPNSPTGELSQDDRSFEDDFLPVVPSPIPGPTTTKNMEHESLQSKAYLAHLGISYTSLILYWYRLCEHVFGASVLSLNQLLPLPILLYRKF